MTRDPPVSTQTRLELAEALGAMGETQGALAVVQAALRDAPSNPGARQLEAALIRATGPEAGQDDEARLRQLGPFRAMIGDLIPASFLTSGSDLDRLHALPVQATEGDWEILEEASHLLIEADGSAHRLTRRVLRAGPRGIELPPTRGQWRWPFDPSRASITVLAATRFDPAPAAPGGWSRRPLRGIRTEAQRDGPLGLYSETRDLVIPFGAVPAGTIIELLWIVNPTGHFFPGHFELLEPLHLEIPRHRYALSAVWPQPLSPHASIAEGLVGAGGITVDTSVPGRLHVEVGPTPAIPREPFAPPRAEVSPVLQLTTFTSWAALASWYAELIAPQVAWLPTMRSALRELERAHTGKGGAMDAAGLARSIVALVASRIRYVGLEFGIHGYKPYRTDDVWARRFGDCKDQALLLVALLDAVGIAADPVLVRTRRLGRIGRSDRGPAPMLAAFDHAIVRLRSTGHFVDPTALHFGYDVLHPDNQGAQALIVPMSPGLTPSLITLPRGPATRNGTRGDMAVHVNRDGSAHVAGHVHFIGTLAGNWRARLSEEAQRRERVETMLGARFDGFTLTHFAIEGLDPDAPALKLRFEGDVSRLAHSHEGSLWIPAPLPLGGQRQRLGTTEGRTLPLSLGPPSSGRFEVRYTLPMGHALAELPEAYRAEAAGVSARTHWSRDPESALAPARVVGTVELTFHDDTLSPVQLLGLAEVLEGLDAALARGLRMETPSE